MLKEVLHCLFHSFSEEVKQAFTLSKKLILIFLKSHKKVDLFKKN